MHLILTKEIVIEFTSDMSYGLPISEVHLRDCQRILVTFLGEENAKLTANRDWSEGIVIRLASSAFIYYFKVVSQVSNDWNDCHGSVFDHSSRISVTFITVNEMPELRWLYTQSQHYIGNYDPILIRSEIAWWCQKLNNKRIEITNEVSNTRRLKKSQIASLLLQKLATKQTMLQIC